MKNRDDSHLEDTYRIEIENLRDKISDMEKFRLDASKEKVLLKEKEQLLSEYSRK